MKQSGRVSLLTVVGIVGIIAVALLMFFSREAPSTAASRFMSALAKGDAHELTGVSYIDGQSPEEIKKKWTYTTEVAGKYYRFRWRLGTEMINDENVASVKVQVMRNSDSDSSYDENFALPMVRKDGKWLVDVKAISRTMYPSLPR